MPRSTSLLTPEQAAEMLGWSDRTLQNRRWRGEPPAYVRIGRNIRYDQTELEKFIEAGRVDPDAEQAA
jgi:excisionase family DNA binding protein